MASNRKLDSIHWEILDHLPDERGPYDGRLLRPLKGLGLIEEREKKGVTWIYPTPGGKRALRQYHR